MGIAGAKRGGRPPFEPTPEQRQLVQNLSGIGCTREEILLCVPWGTVDGKPIAMKTLLKHFDPELSRGTALANMRLKKKAYEMALSGDVAMLVFWLKTRCGWRTTAVVESTGAGGEPLPPMTAQTFIYAPDLELLQEVPAAEQRMVTERQLQSTVPASSVRLFVDDRCEPAAIGDVKRLDSHIERGFRA